MKGTQSKKGSLTESFVNVLAGYFVAVGSQIIIFPWFNINIPLHENLIIGLFFTVISIVRSFLLRRFFNHFNF
ncbi:TPA_asm: hp [Altiarchaeum virus]|nr:TPA_asm: hp [Altiarchaeum virus]